MSRRTAFDRAGDERARRFREHVAYAPKLGDRVKYHGTATEYRVSRVNDDGSVVLTETNDPSWSHRSTPRLLTLVERAA